MPLFLPSAAPERLRLTLAGSLEHNDLGSEGAKHLSEGLKENKALTSLKYVVPRLVS